VFRYVFAGAALVAGLAVAAPLAAQPPKAPPTVQVPSPTYPNPSAVPIPSKNDYSKAENWLCRPGGNDACAIDLTTTVIAADGKLTRETFAANAKAPIDCFYVYPTVSNDQTTNSDMTAGPEETNVIRQQFARFASVCRPFAPLYRQVTLGGLRAAMAPGGKLVLDRGLGYDDVLDAWTYYLKNDNNGRGVVLIGHSQGAMVLTALIANEIDGKPIQSRLVSAILLGTSLPVPKGKDVGGAFKNIPLCRSAEQIGCAISYASFRSTVPPPPNTLFGRVAGEGMEAACTNPAALAGGTGQLHAYMTGAGTLIASAAPQKHQWVTGGAVVDTPFVSVPGLLSAKCATNEHGTFLEVTVHPEPADPRADDITGDLGAPGRPLANWGLHLVDVNLAMGNLVDIVAKQSKAYLSKRRPTQ
jgi:Protein of unknown function (DUF3089)